MTSGNSKPFIVFMNVLDISKIKDVDERNKQFFDIIDSIESEKLKRDVLNEVGLKWLQSMTEEIYVAYAGFFYIHSFPSYVNKTEKMCLRFIDEAIYIDLDLDYIEKCVSDINTAQITRKLNRQKILGH